MEQSGNKSKGKDAMPISSEAAVFPVVAIGASAGGLEAVSELLKYLSPETGMAFIYVQHLKPDHKSMLAPLLSKITSMDVREVEDKVLIKPDSFYIIPPDKEISVDYGHIILRPRPASPKFNLPIDILFSSLAKTHHENVIGVVLSGSATDGTIGMKAIKEHGGLTFAQDKTAKFDSMPKSAISAGIVDFILSPKEIAEELNRLSNHPLVRNDELKSREEDLINDDNHELKAILSALFQSTGVDFTAYKMRTIKRRILRRMLLNRVDDLQTYLELIGEKKEELDILYQDLLINVTSFFRDSDTYKFLKEFLIPKLLKSKKAGESLRIWVPACSSGEEAFSIAMMILEVQEKMDQPIPIKMFATDLSEKAIAKARIGIYTKSELESVYPKRLQRFFSKNDGNYKISKTIRDICVFATHNVLKDPPFSKIDFISCRNLFIYFDNLAQKRVLATFHYALNETGYLMLGKAETISSSTHLFTQLDKKFKIYLKKSNSDNLLFTLPNKRMPKKENHSANHTENKGVHSPFSELNDKQRSMGLAEAIDDIIIADFLPSCVVINQQHEIKQFRGNTDLYFSHVAGKASLNIFKLVRKEIAFHLRNLISKSFKTNQRIRKGGIEVSINNAPFIISIEVAPLHLASEEQLMLVVFSHHEQILGLKEMKGNGDGQSTQFKLQEKRINQLEEELASSHEAAVELAHDQEGFIEELQSANEEIVSSNEELQTVNEELETSKEELESSNEELITTNQELQTRNDLLSESYDYSKAIISTLHEPLIVLDKDLQIKTTNDAFYRTFGLKKEALEGKILFDLEDKNWDIPKLREFLEQIIPKNPSFVNFKLTHSFPRIGEKVFLLNSNRIVQKSHGEQLILLSFNDITETEKVQKDELETHAKDMKESQSYSLKLEKAVRERTKQLDHSNKTLEERNDDLAKINKELEAFAYVSSHDLQEPLRKIQTFADRILEKELPNLSPNGKTYFIHMQKSANRMQLLIEELLAFSSLSSAERKFETLQLEEIVNEVEKELKEELEEKNAVIELHDMCDISVIPFQFRQLIQNLTRNSLKFSKPNEPVKIIISSRILNKKDIKISENMSHKSYCHITFSDNGIGFNQEYSKRIFEVFEKLHSKDEYPGTGIGLAIVKKVVDNHNGFIFATSESNKGTIFDIYLPAKL
ncbi:CheR family methyltransferase [Pararhodonellum marinum]|uniref:CheR family methyltransferase n=1 Tax=Pararhodonellum marinum TaxID=2755358 RepID=UPI00189022C4|nr:CheR family methyltransferase [Pararhodonellum marinum]